MVAERLEVPVTFRDVLKNVEAFRVVKFAVDMLDVPATNREDVSTFEDEFRVAMLAVARFEIPETFIAELKNDAAFNVVKLVVERLDSPLTFIVVAKRPAAFITKAFPLV